MAVEPGSSFLVVLPPASPRVCTRPLRLRTSGGALAPSHSWNPTPLPLRLGCLPSLPPLSLLPARENSLLFRVHAISSHPLRQSEIIFPPQGPKHLQGRCFCLKDHSHSFQGLQRRHFGEPSCLPHPSQCHQLGAPPGSLGVVLSFFAYFLSRFNPWGSPVHSKMHP